MSAASAGCRITNGLPSSGEQAKQREHATPSRTPRGGTRYGGAEFVDIDREPILKDRSPRGHLIQRFGSALNLNPHLHMLFVDAAYAFDDEAPRFHRVAAPTQTELQRLLHAIATRVTRALERQRLLTRDDETPSLDLEPDDGLAHLLGAAVHYHIAIGPHAGREDHDRGCPVRWRNFESPVFVVSGIILRDSTITDGYGPRTSPPTARRPDHAHGGAVPVEDHVLDGTGHVQCEQREEQVAGDVMHPFQDFMKRRTGIHRRRNADGEHVQRISQRPGQQVARDHDGRR